MPEEISQYRPTWLEKIANAFRDWRKYGHMKNVGPIDTGDTLMNERLFQILASLKDEVPLASSVSFKPMGWLFKIAGNPVYEPRLGGSYDPATQAVEVYTQAKAYPPEVLLHELAHARNYYAPYVPSSERLKNLEVIESTLRGYGREFDEDLAYAVGRRLAPLAGPYTRVRQEDFDRAYAEELDKVLTSIRDMYWNAQTGGGSQYGQR